MSTTSPVPVLLMVRALTIGGTERQLTETAKCLDRRRFSPHVGCFIREGLRRQELEQAAVPILHLPVTSFKSPGALREAAALVRYIRRNRIRIVHTFDVPMNVFGVLPARIAGTPLVLSSQRAHRELASGAERRLLRVTDRLVDGTVVNCEAVRRHLTEDEGVDPQRIHLCYNGIDATALTSGDPAPSPFPEGSVVIGVVCALRAEKDLDTLIRAFQQIHSAHPSARLLFVGSGPEERPLKELAASLGVASRCHFEPGTPLVGPWLQRIDIFVLPSRSEALSNALMEAMACGCCPVASRVGGNPELVRDGENGLLFQAGDDAGLARQLSRLMEDRVLRKHFGETSAERIHHEFSLDRSAGTMMDIYDRLLVRKQAAG